MNAFAAAPAGTVIFWPLRRHDPPLPCAVVST
jgi:hypothetical protein